MIERETAQMLDLINALLANPDVPCTLPDSMAQYPWRLLRWESDEPLAPDQQAAALDMISTCMQPAGIAQGRFSEDGSQLYILVCLTQFRAGVHRDVAMWLCAHGILESCTTLLEQEGALCLSDEFASPGAWQEAAASLYDLSDWWRTASPIDSTAARTHRTKLQTIIKRRQYNMLCGYITRSLRTEREVNRVCFGFVPLTIEAIWSQHPELSLRDATIALSLVHMTRKPQETLLTWLTSLQPLLHAHPAPLTNAPIERVIDSIRSNCALPYSQANLSRSLGLTPAYFCRLFHEKTGMHFSTFLTTTRMDKARELLSQADVPSLQEVSSACGYPNKSYFCQVFKKHTGLTPGKFEQQAKKENT